MSPNSNAKLIVIAGPTAVGKTALSIALAKALNCEIVSCDSRQVYKELRIGVARPSAQELASVPHHFIASHSIHQDFNAAHYAREAHALLIDLFKEHEHVILTGGTGLFIRALVDGLDPLPPSRPERRAELEHIKTAQGVAGLQDILNSLDPHSPVDRSNPQRLIRAIEILEQDLPEAEEFPRAQFHTLRYYLDMDRTLLYDRINARVDAMLDEGLEEEARALWPYRELNALKTVGYSEFFTYFDGSWSLAQAVDKIKQHSRNYAKRQLTWFRNQGFSPLPLEADKALASIQMDLRAI